MQKTNQKKSFWRKYLNIYVVVSIVFVVWMLFFDQNSYLLHKELNEDIERLEGERAYFQEQLDQESEELENLEKNPEAYEKLAREKYWMKKANEEIFIIETPDSTQYE